MINGDLNAENIILKINQGRVKHIEGSLIKVKGKGGILRTDSIKGETLHLESTKADLVQGKKVDIGKQCEIGHVKAEQLKTH